jgi:hypothetical protein
MWTTVPKPGAQTYTNIGPMGKEQYDQSSLTYDDANVFYDGINPSQWTDVAKPTGGYEIPWSEMDMLWENASNPWGSTNPWTNVAKPT